MKYIVFKHLGDEVPVLFSDIIQHRSMAAIMGLTDKQLISAGFVAKTRGEIDAFGESYTLNLQSRPEDTRIIADLF